MQRIVVGISGASGVVYGVRALEMLRALDIETHLVMSKSAELTIHYELDQSAKEVKALASEVHSVRDVGASIASGSFKSLGMLIAPCSIRTLGEITSGVTSSLLTRAADVALKDLLRAHSSFQLTLASVALCPPLTSLRPSWAAQRAPSARFCGGHRTLACSWLRSA